MTQLIKYEAARQALQQATRVDEVKGIKDRAEAVRVYARQAGDVDMQTWAVEIKLRAERKAGELLKEMNKSGGGKEPTHKGTGNNKVTGITLLRNIGISKNQSSKWQKTAAISELKFEAVIAQAKAEKVELTSALVHRAVKNKSTVVTLTSSETNEWYTPARYIEAARAVLGKIDLDPASNEHANKTVKAAKFYDEHRDGLKKEWSGRVWLNPPYGDIGPKFIAKLLKEFKDGEILQAILLVNANTDTKWFKPLFDHVICFTDHRVKFENPSAEKDSPTHGSAFVFLGSDARSFAKHFAQFGTIVTKYKEK